MHHPTRIPLRNPIALRTDAVALLILLKQRNEGGGDGRWGGLGWGGVWGWWGGGVSSSLCCFGVFFCFFFSSFPYSPHLPPLTLHTPSPHLSRSIKPATTTNPSSYPHSPPRDLYPIPSSRHAIRIPSPPIYHNPSPHHQTQSPPPPPPLPRTPNPPPPSPSTLTLAPYSPPPFPYKSTNPQTHKPANRTLSSTTQPSSEDLPYSAEGGRPGEEDEVVEVRGGLER
jgi:hypothetical protein